MGRFARRVAAAVHGVSSVVASMAAAVGPAALAAARSFHAPMTGGTTMPTQLAERN